MRFDELVFFIRQARRLVDDVDWDANLADIVQQADGVDGLLRLLVIARTPRDLTRVRRDALRMAARVTVFDVDGLREREDEFAKQPLARCEAFLGERRLVLDLDLEMRLQVFIAQDARDAQAQHVRKERLVQEVRRTSLEAARLEVCCHVARQQDDGQVCCLERLADTREHRDAIVLRHHVVEQHEIDGVFRKIRKRVLPARHFHDFIRFPEDALNHHEAHFVIINGQNARRQAERQRTRR